MSPFCFSGRVEEPVLELGRMGQGQRREFRVWRPGKPTCFLEGWASVSQYSVIHRPGRQAPGTQTSTPGDMRMRVFLCLLISPWLTKGKRWAEKQDRKLQENSNSAPLFYQWIFKFWCSSSSNMVWIFRGLPMSPWLPLFFLTTVYSVLAHLTCFFTTQ